MINVMLLLLKWMDMGNVIFSIFSDPTIFESVSNMEVNILFDFE